ncbi:hypothetical protein SAT01_31270 [Sinomonas atrocyanea]|nr:hypothetical protein SAT01_31270 [Sinomonas atrocyanea]GGG79665.1 hypothetical protein GCM10007172_36020 [Sinomonas atrocyanea]
MGAGAAAPGTSMKVGGDICILGCPVCSGAPGHGASQEQCSSGIAGEVHSCGAAAAGAADQDWSLRQMSGPHGGTHIPAEGDR